MNDETAKQLREPFPREVIGKLPRVTCKDCRDNKGQCGQHKRVNCRLCRNWITPAHIHLDYVGHAEVTDRLLQVDPDWSWEPLAFGPDGLPALDRNGGLWIRLTIAGTSRLGYGAADGKTGPDAVKETIGDAVRNAAMRFGVGLDLWGATYKGEEEPQPEEDAGQASRVAIDLFALVVDAYDQDSLRLAWTAIVDAQTDHRINEREASQLHAHVKKRKAELEYTPTGEQIVRPGVGAS